MKVGIIGIAAAIADTPAMPLENTYAISRLRSTKSFDDFA
jgi:hypothetical protein